MVDGDARSAAIAAASVIAKVTRDRYMHRIADALPGCEFDGNVGYSTPEHRAAIVEHGPSPLHRRSFASIAYSQLELGLDARSGVDDHLEAAEEHAPQVHRQVAARPSISFIRRVGHHLRR